MTTNFFAAARSLIFSFVVGLVVSFGSSELSAQGNGSNASLLDFGAAFGEDLVLEDIGRAADGRLFYTANQTISGNNVARLIEVAADRQSFTSSELIGEGETVVAGIAADASWVSGFSNTAASDGREAYAWNSNNPSNGIALGFGSEPVNLSRGFGAHSNGVVGSVGGLNDGFNWTSDGSFNVLPDPGGLSFARDASLDGGIIVGTSSNFGGTAGAVFWDEAGINPLDDPYGIDSTANAVSTSARIVGGQVGFFDIDTFESGFLPAVWSRDESNEFSLSLIEMVDPATGSLARIFGRIQDVSDGGWAVGSFINSDDIEAGLIWHESFNGIDSTYLGAQSFDEWLAFETGLLLPSASTSVVGVSEDPLTGTLSFAIDGVSSAYAVCTGAGLLGDVNLDGVVNLLDVAPFVDLITDGSFQSEADLNQDGVVNLLDVAPFVSLLSS